MARRPAAPCGERAAPCLARLRTHLLQGLFQSHSLLLAYEPINRPILIATCTQTDSFGDELFAGLDAAYERFPGHLSWQRELFYMTYC